MAWLPEVAEELTQGGFSALLDLLLAVNIAGAVLVILASMQVSRPLDFAVFPSLLLVLTLFRLALNISTTRLIMLNGYAGKVIEAFGAFLVGGNFAVGLVVFLILVIINFMVITKGAGRIAEVGARFTLDAMPGKQMAIDADLSAGLINEDEARTRRKDLEDESTFFGAMDGASKFVRGDAIAGLMITFINVIGGIIIGVAQNDMSFMEAGQTYTLLTVGDGLVSQIPALIVSTAAGLLVSKAGVDGEADKAVFGQLTANPQGLGLVSAVAFMVGVLPGMPFLPFALMSACAGALAWMNRDIVERKAQEALEAEAEKVAEEASGQANEKLNGFIDFTQLMRGKAN